MDRKFKRRCISCGVYKPKTQLVRLLYTSSVSGEVQAQCIFPIDSSLVKLPADYTPLGRSAYVCNVDACRTRAVQQRGRAVAGALRRSPSEALLEQLSPKD